MSQPSETRDATLLQDAYQTCQRIASRHYENFPVASWLLPSGMRPHVAAVYAFARGADDFADEGDHPDNVRLKWLDDWHRRLDACIAHPPVASSSSTPDIIFHAVGDTIRSCGVPPQLFADLLSAFRQDVTTKRYESWDALLDYCSRSANPVGRIVLHVARATRSVRLPPSLKLRRTTVAWREGGQAEGQLDDVQVVERASDSLCTALQLTNFWQDLAVDWQRGRVYVPRSVLHRVGAVESDLNQERLTPAWRDGLSEVVDRTRQCFDEGRAVCDAVSGRLRFELRLTWLGGTTILDRIESRAADFRSRPTIRSRDLPRMLLRSIVWDRGGSHDTGGVAGTTRRSRA